ncbi:MAG: hypothetical protein AB4290_07100 [Spirulina sp.]
MVAKWLETLDRSGDRPIAISRSRSHQSALENLPFALKWNPRSASTAPGLWDKGRFLVLFIPPVREETICCVCTLEKAFSSRQKTARSKQNPMAARSVFSHREPLSSDAR